MRRTRWHGFSFSSSRRCRIKVVTVIGARPQFIKAAAVSRVLRAWPDVEEVLVHTGQHFDENMSRVFFEELGIPQVDYNLGISGGSHGEMTGRMLVRIEAVIEKERPDWVLVYGDTNSTLAGALATVKLGIPVAHVEAGLRSFNRRMPEEINRILTDHASDLLLAPTQTALRNLLREGIPAGKIRLVGDVMYDSALYYGMKADRESRILERLRLRPGSYILATVHRAENTDDPVRLRNILEALVELQASTPVIMPVHPRTRFRADEFGLVHLQDRLLSIEPVGYLDMVKLEKNALLVVTDSGGVQKEAFIFGRPCVTLREETEWTETVEEGWNKLVGADREKIREAVEHFSSAALPERRANPYGDGRAAERIVEILVCLRGGG